MFLSYNKYTKVFCLFQKQTCFDNKSRHNVYNVTNFRLNKRASVNPADTRFNSAIQKKTNSSSILFFETNQLIQNPVLPLRMA